MKRFYCTICQRVKRVRKYPLDVVGVENELPESRVGTCSRHSLKFASKSEYRRVVAQKAVR